MSFGARKHAIVIGGSMGGLLAARVLADYYERVTLVERDAFPPIGEQRRGVPQGPTRTDYWQAAGKFSKNCSPGYRTRW